MGIDYGEIAGDINDNKKRKGNKYVSITDVNDIILDKFSGIRKYYHATEENAKKVNEIICDVLSSSDNNHLMEITDKEVSYILYKIAKSIKESKEV